MTDPIRPLGKRDGFTLLELIVALVIVSILASIALVNYNKVQVHAQAAAISHDIHLLEDVLLEAAVAGHVGPHNAPSSLADLRALLPDDSEAVLEPQLPEGMSLGFSGVGDYALLIMVQGESRHQPVLDALAAMRPATTQEVGTMVLEAVDFRTLTPENPSAVTRN